MSEAVHFSFLLLLPEEPERVRQRRAAQAALTSCLMLPGKTYKESDGGCGDLQLFASLVTYNMKPCSNVCFNAARLLRTDTWISLTEQRGMPRRQLLHRPFPSSQKLYSIDFY